MSYVRETRLWNRFLESRTRLAAPGALLLRRSGDTFERVHRFEGWVAYRGLVFDFTSNYGRDKPGVVIYARPAAGVLARVAQRTLDHSIRTLSIAVARADAHIDTMSWLANALSQSVDGVPWEIHLIRDPDARAAATAAYIENESR